MLCLAAWFAIKMFSTVALQQLSKKKIIGEIDISVIRVQPKQMFVVQAGCLHHFQALVFVHSKHSGLEQNSGLLGGLCVCMCICA